jgi:cell division protein FtsN
MTTLEAASEDTKSFQQATAPQAKPETNAAEAGKIVSEIDKKADEAKPMERSESVAAKATTPSTSDQRIRMIQVGAFRNKDSALQQTTALQQKGYDARIVEPGLGEIESIYRVRILSYDDLGKTSATIDKLRNDGFDAFTVPSNRG